MPQAYATNFQTPTPLASAEKENPTARWGFPVINFGLAALLTLLTALAGPRRLLLLLLAGLLLPATLLLLSWLLTGGLVLLARILVGIAHSGLPC